MKDLKLYTIMPIFDNHVDEVCEDIREQYEKGVANCALFSMTLVPEGNPPVNKAEMLGKKYGVYKKKLDSMGLRSGILVQATIGHGRLLGAASPFTKLDGLNPSAKKSDVCCPYDDGFCNYMRDTFATLASYNPDEIMVDDDFRLLQRAAAGCACHLHMAEFNKRAGTSITKEELFREISENGNSKYSEIFVETQRDSLLKAARAMREGIDSVNPRIPGSYCGCGINIEFAEDIAKVLAGEGNPTVVRINNGNYTPAGARNLSQVSYRAARQAEYIRDKVDVILAETDTCPQNRYSTGAYSLHAHFVASILEGAKGAKHWITRLREFEPNSGKAYRKVLSKYSGFYRELARIEPELSWLGFRIPLTKNRRFIYDDGVWLKNDATNGWAVNVIERFGFPMYYSSKSGGIVCLSGDADKKFTNEELLEMLKGPIFLSSDAAERLIERGLGDYLGVDVAEWQGKFPSVEKILKNSKKCNVQIGRKELIPRSNKTEISSMVYHGIDGENYEPLFPATTVFKNSLGGTAVVFCGTPVTKFNYLEAFSFLNESRKRQFIDILQELGELEVYYPGDEEVYLRAARMPDSSLFVCLFNIGLDPIDEIELAVSGEVSGIELISQTGKRIPLEFKKTGDRVLINRSANVLAPVALIMRK